MSKMIIELKIELKDIKPKIWRTFQVEANTTFKQLHKIIQKVMGWEDYHLYDFKVSKTNIIDERLEDQGELKANKAKLSNFIEQESQKFSYMYDMGDS